MYFWSNDISQTGASEHILSLLHSLDPVYRREIKKVMSILTQQSIGCILIKPFFYMPVKRSYVNGEI